MATPLGKVRGLGSARRGTETFWRQRLTAIANIPLVIFLIFSIAANAGADYAMVRAYFAHPIVALAMLALVLSASVHMRIGLKEIIEDYVHNEFARIASILFVTFFAFGVGLVAAYALVKISLGS